MMVCRTIARMGIPREAYLAGNDQTHPFHYAFHVRERRIGDCRVVYK
jgi:hypothetical protein